jgi:hypothetical protein
MNAKNTWLWMVVAGGLFAFIYFFHRPHAGQPETPARVLPGLKAAAVTNLQVRPDAQLEIQAVRTNDNWRLLKPVSYPATGAAINHLLEALERLAPASFIKPAELQNHPKADEDFGLATPQATLNIQQPGYQALLQIGARTAPGDQVFLRVVGSEGICVADAEFLKFLPRHGNDWRDPVLVDLNSFAFDRVSVTNGAKIFELRRDASNQFWRIVYPFYPQSARANNTKVHDALESLHSLRVLQFLPDDPKPDLEALGLQPPELEVAIAQGTNTIALLQFGKSPTNDSHLAYARRAGLNAVGTVSADLATAWREKVNAFRDPHLVALTTPVFQVDAMCGTNQFTVQYTNGAWVLLPGQTPVETAVVEEMIATLCRMEIVDFVSDVVIAADLPAYGLAQPARRYFLRSDVGGAPDGTNHLIAELDFGTNQADKVFARRPDEGFVYAVKAADLQPVPTAGWQLRKRGIFGFSTNDVAALTINQEGRARKIVRNGPFSWSLAPGSQGIINDLAVEEVVSDLGQLYASSWVAQGKENRARYGFTEKGHTLTLELKNGSRNTVEFGGEAPSGFRYAGVTQNGEFWIFEFPPVLYQYVSQYLTVPASPTP